MPAMPPGAKRAVHGLLAALAEGARVEEIYHENAVWSGSHPFGELSGRRAIGELWRQLRSALPDMERRDLLFVGGDNRDDPRLDAPRAPHLVAAIGHLQGTFETEFRDIPPTHGVVHLRYAEAHWLDGDRIRRSWAIIDLLDLMRQAGIWPLPPSLGAEGMWPGPATQDGIRLDDAPPIGPDSLETVFAMHEALLAFDGENLDSMPHEEHWTKNFMYYAGAGIGACRGLAGFRAHHQIPFLRAFPDRKSRGHFIRVSDGPYAVTGGTVFGTHSAEIMGMSATGKTIDVKVMDFYRLEGTRIAENWLPIDVLGMASQMGCDVFERLRHYGGLPRKKI